MKFAKVPASIRAKLSGLWVATTLCYIYADYFSLYAPGKLADLNRGLMEPLGKTTEGKLLGVSILMAIPCLMVMLSLMLPARSARWANMILATAFVFIQGATMLSGAAQFYLFFGLVEMTMCIAIAWTAFHWPREHTV